MAGERLAGAHVEITFETQRGRQALDADIAQIIANAERSATIEIDADLGNVSESIESATESLSAIEEIGEDAASAVESIGDAALGTDAALESIGATGEGAAQGVAQIGEQAEAASSHVGQLAALGAGLRTQLTSQVDALGARLGALGPAGATAASGIGSLGGAAGPIAALGAAATLSIRSVVNLAQEVRTFQQLSGASAEDASRFVAVLDDFKLPAQVGANALFILGRRAASGATELAKLDIEVAKNREGQVDLVETTLNVADAYASTTDPARRAEIATAAFGKQGRDLIPILEQGREGLAAFFEGAEQGRQILSQEEIDKARELELSIDALQDAAGGLARNLGTALLPAITAIGKALEAVSPLLDVFGDIMGGLLAPTNALLNLLPGVGDEAEDAAPKVQDLGTEADAAAGSFDAMAGFVTASEVALENASEAIEDFQGKLEATLGVVLSTEEASSRYQESIDKLSESLKENGNRFDAQTEKGRANRDALHDVVDGINDYVGALVASGRIQNTDAAQKAATIQRLQEMQRRFPRLKEEIQNYVDAIREGIPSDVTTEFKIDDRQARSAIRRLRDQLDTLGVPRQAFRFELAALRGAQHGGTFGPGEIVRVGEGGKEELVQGLPGGGFKVFPDASKFSGAGVYIENFNVNEIAQDPVATARRIAWELGTEAR